MEHKICVNQSGFEESNLLDENNSLEIYSSVKKCAKKNKCVSCWYFSIGSLSILWAIFASIWTPFDLLMNERIKMTPGLPPFDWWKIPPDKVLLRVHIFNVTNSEEFLANSSVKLNVEEIGPFIFMEKLTHTNITFNENGTLTYVASRKPIFLPEMNTINLNSTIIIPNYAVLGLASYLYDEGFFMKLGFNIMLRTMVPKPFLKVTINEFFWNMSEPIMEKSHKIAPSLVPITNLGILEKIYKDFTNVVTVYIGPKYGHNNFFLIDKYDGSEFLPFWGDSCPNERVQGGTEGVLYPQFINPNMTLTYWRITLCRNAVLRYNNTANEYGLEAFRYILPDSTFNRTVPEENDCFRSDPVLPDGISDIATCHFGFPLGDSFPHFLYGDDVIHEYVTGLDPSEEKHGSYLVVEPITGVPLQSVARSQCNLVVRKLSGFHELVTRFSDTVIPMFWLEYSQIGLPWYILTLVYFQVNVLPILQKVFVGLLLLASIVCFYFALKRRRNANLMLERNKTVVFEKDQKNCLMKGQNGGFDEKDMDC